MCKNLLLKICAFFLILFQYNQCYPFIKIGVITENNDFITIPVVEETKNMLMRNRPFHNEIKAINEQVDFNNAFQLDKSVCRFLKAGVIAIFASPNLFAYQMLQSFSKEYSIPLLIPSLPDVSSDLLSPFVYSLQPQTARVLIDVLQRYNWENIFYLYDSNNGPGKLQKIFQFGYTEFQIQLAGLFKVSDAYQANEYLKQLRISGKNGKFYVIIDTDSSLAKDILVRHAHDAHIEKKNYHFLIANPVFLEAAEFRSINVTGFVTLPMNPAYFRKTDVFYKQQSNLTVSAYYLREAVLVFGMSLAIDPMYRIKRPFLYWHHHGGQMEEEEEEEEDCFEMGFYNQQLVDHKRFNFIIKQVNAYSPMTGGKITFDENNVRNNFKISVIERSPEGYRKVADYSSASVKSDNFTITLHTNFTGSQNGRKNFKVISMLSPPFLMLHSTDDGTELEGNGRFKGFAKDLTEILAKKLDFDYEIVLLEDRIYGDYDESKGQWTGIIGEIIQGKADIAITDLQITASLQKVVDFLNEPICSTSLSILMKDPRSSTFTTSTPFYILSSFSTGIWVCIVITAIIIIILFHVMLSFTGSYDSIEATSYILDETFNIIASAWFICGSSMIYDTGIYPRSIPCRILSGTWWCFTLVCLAFFIANTATRFYIDNTDKEHHPQLVHLLSLSVDSIIKESVQNNWPHLGILRNGSAHTFIQKSNLPTYTSLVKYFQYHSNYIVDDINSGLQRVRDFAGDYAFIMESIKGDYYNNEGPCNTISIHDTLPYAEYGIAIPFGSSSRYDLNNALKSIKENGELAHLRRKWFVDELRCDLKNQKNNDRQNLTTLSGIFYIILIGLLIAGLACILQYVWKDYKWGNRGHKLSSEEVILDQNLSSPEQGIPTE